MKLTRTQQASFVTQIETLRRRAKASTSPEEIERILFDELPEVMLRAKGSRPESLQAAKVRLVDDAYRPAVPLEEREIDGVVKEALSNPSLSLETIGRDRPYFATPRDDEDDRYARALRSNPALLFWWATHDTGFLQVAANMYASRNAWNPLFAVVKEVRLDHGRGADHILRRAVWNAAATSLFRDVMGIDGVTLPAYDPHLTPGERSIVLAVCLDPVRHLPKTESMFQGFMIILSGSNEWLHRLLLMCVRTLDYTDYTAWTDERRQDSFPRWIGPYVRFVEQIAREAGVAMPPHLLDGVEL